MSENVARWHWFPKLGMYERRNESVPRGIERIDPDDMSVIVASLEDDKRALAAERDALEQRLRDAEVEAALIPELLDALKRVVAVADRQTDDFIYAHAIITKADHLSISTGG